MKPTFFRTPADFRRWLAKNHARATELLVGFHKVNSGKPSITWPESVDEALCFGWIDGIRRRIDDSSYSIRFTPRKADSTWSAINIKRARALSVAGRMQPSGLQAFEARADERSAIYSYEQRHAATLTPDLERRFHAVRPAWKFFQAQAPSYRKAAIWWVLSAKKEATRLKRLEKLIADSRAGNRLPMLTPNRSPK